MPDDIEAGRLSCVEAAGLINYYYHTECRENHKNGPHKFMLYKLV